jgi:hypothetical protein
VSEGSKERQDRWNSGTVPPTVKVRTPASKIEDSAEKGVLGESRDR